MRGVLHWKRTEEMKPKWGKWLTVVGVGVLAASCSDTKTLPRNASDTGGQTETAAQTENIVKTVDKAEAIRTARGVLTGQYLPDPVQIVEKESS
jgi:hypothetical protein